MDVYFSEEVYKLARKYSDHGVTEEAINENIVAALDYGVTPGNALLALRFAFAMQTDQEETFTAYEAAVIAGLSEPRIGDFIQECALNGAIYRISPIPYLREVQESDE